jgi:hypothetical protein
LARTIEMKLRKTKDEIKKHRESPDREERLLELLRTTRGPKPSPEYLAAFWPRLQEKLRPRRPAILHPLYYGGLAAAAALVLWVSLGDPDTAGRVRPELPVYALGTVSSPIEGERQEMSYVSGQPREEKSGRRRGIDYILPRISAGAAARLEV